MERLRAWWPRAEAAQGQRRDALLHGRRLPQPEAAAVRRRSRQMVSEVARARPRDLRDARHADAAAGDANSRTPGSTTTTTTSTRRKSSTARSSRRAPTRTGSTRCRRCATRGSTSAAAASSAWASPSTIASQLLHTLATLPQHPESVPINQLVQVAGHAARRPAAARPARLRARDRDRAPPDAALVRAAVGRPHRHERRGAGAVLPRRRQLDLLRREAADDAESRHERDDALFARLGLEPEECRGRDDGRLSRAVRALDGRTRRGSTCNALPGGDAAARVVESRGTAARASGRRARRHRVLQQRLPRPRGPSRRDRGVRRSGAALGRRQRRLAPRQRPRRANTTRWRKNSPRYTGRPRALLFSTGYMANLAVGARWPAAATACSRTGSTTPR